ncbi:hypothetical protein PILCRDRAFT_92775 [Piloderma croceum F 1598]|uniref:Uncharacterized protein n=1 Tax=Piloderma croceum (strain F 1598) TaxID=765440 RepID=A0A0C3F2D3_PILCF|nr:hypothetical protein PILCRDRAFT_92775 [Piloderma croceum F 1598]
MTIQSGPDILAILAPVPQLDAQVLAQQIQHWEDDLKASCKLTTLCKTGAEQEKFDWRKLQQENLIVYQVLQFCKEVTYYIMLTCIFPVKAIPVLYTILRDGVSLFGQMCPNQQLTAYCKNAVIALELQSLGAIPAYFFKYTTVLLNIYISARLLIKKARGSKEQCFEKEYICSGLSFEIELEFHFLVQTPEFIQCSVDWSNEGINNLVVARCATEILKGD